MSNRMSLPVDFDSTNSFGNLSALLQSRDRAVCLYTLLFKQLTYDLREGGVPGMIHKENRGNYEARLGVKLDDLVGTKLLHSKSDGWYCPQFVDAGNLGVSMSAAGGRAKGYNARVRKGLQTLAGETLLIPAEKFVDARGEALPAERVTRIRQLVLCCDCALTGAPRDVQWQYSESLIQNANTLLARYTDEQINAACEHINQHRTHPSVAGLRTEELLAPTGEGRSKFDEILAELNG